MTSRNLTRERILEIIKCYDHLPEPENREMTILKGHLLIETRLKGYIARKLPNPDGCNLDRFKFSLLTELAQGLCASRHQDNLWQSIQKLNTLRNRLSHELDDIRLSTALENFLDFHTKHFFKGDSEHRNVHSCVVSLYSSLVHLVAEDTEQANSADG